MRLFFINWGGKGLGLADTVKELKKDHEIIYWTSPNISDEASAAEFPGTILHDHADALKGKPAKEFEDKEFAPPSEELLKKLYETESIVLTMMNKLFEKLSLSERKHLYHAYIKYWNGVMLKCNPDAVIFPVIPHTVYDYVIYALAKIYNIKTVMMEPLWIGDRMAVMGDYIEGPKIFAGAAGSLSSDLKEEYILQTGSNISEAEAAPVMFVKTVKRKYSGIAGIKVKARSFWTTITVLKDFSIFAKIFMRIFRGFLPNQRKEYESLVFLPDFNKKFIYFPLHYQPERNSSPQGGVFVDQILMAETLSASLPEGWFLYIKEHPTQWFYRGLDYFSYRFKGYYSALAKLKNTKILPIETSTRDLTKHAQVVATITGTAGWEAVLMGKPVLIFGYPWYRNAPGIFRVSSVDECSNVLEKIKNGFSFSEEEIIKYLEALDKSTFHGYIDFDGQKVSKLSYKENSINLKNAILSQL